MTHLIVGHGVAWCFDTGLALGQNIPSFNTDPHSCHRAHTRHGRLWT
jgi:hypothetical protein